MAILHCVIHEGSVADATRHHLATRLIDLHEEVIGDTSVQVLWEVVTPGAMFTGGEPSTTSVVGALLDVDLTPTDRERFLRGVCQLWTRTTGCTDHEVMAAVAEHPES